MLANPGGSVFDDTLVTYVETGAPSSLAVPGFAGRAFRLDAYQANTLMDDFRLYETVEISLTYAAEDVAGLNPNRLTLRAWDEGQWVDDGIMCATDTTAMTVVCTVATPRATQYALLADTSSIYLPLVLNNVASSTMSAEITYIGLSGSQYVVTFQTLGFTPQLPGQHVHFFFDTVSPLEAGLPGSGPWIVYGGPSPFTGYGVADRPVGATQMCVLVANPDHSVIQGTGNCTALP